MQALYSPNRRWSLLARYRLKSKQLDFKMDTKSKTQTMLCYDTHHTFNLQLNCTLSSFLSLRTSATGTLIHFGTNPDETGYAVGENIRWQHPKTKCRVDLGITYFNTDTYNARVYNYEPSLLYTFGSTSYYDQGIRTTLLASLPIFKNKLFLYAKFGMTKYFNRDTISSDLELIDANHREDLQLQARWLF